MNEPVAYMTKEGYVYGKHDTRPIEADIPLYTHSNTQSHPIAWADLEEGQSIPLYTHPMREITDEKILALWVKKNNLNGAKDILDFARDLLKKASEE